MYRNILQLTVGQKVCKAIYKTIYAAVTIQSDDLQCAKLQILLNDRDVGHVNLFILLGGSQYNYVWESLTYGVFYVTTDHFHYTALAGAKGIMSVYNLKIKGH
jgi:hypothetical protein